MVWLEGPRYGSGVPLVRGLAMGRIKMCVARLGYPLVRGKALGGLGKDLGNPGRPWEVPGSPGKALGAKDVR